MRECTEKHVVNNYSRIKSLEGLRGLAALIVLFSHFGVMFYPAFYWENSISHCNGIDALLGQNPISFLLNGNAGVVFFLMVTGFGICNLTIQGDNSPIKKFFILRYVKLLILSFLGIVGVLLIVKVDFLFYKNILHITGTPWFNGYDPIGLKLWDDLRDNPLESFVKYNPVLWPMKYFFIGSGIAYILSVIIKNTPHKLIIVILSFIVFINMNESVYCCITIGVFLSDFYNENKQFKMQFWIIMIIFMLGIYFSAYPTGRIPKTIWYNWLPYCNSGFIIYHSIGVGFLIFTALYDTFWKHILECRLLQFCGKYSSAIFITHYGVLISLSAYAMCRATIYYGYNASVLIAFASSVPAVIAISIIMNYILRFLYERTERIYYKVFE